MLPCTRTSSYLLEVRDVSVWHRARGLSFKAIERVSLGVRPAETLVLLGPSGCGKTTLLRAIAGFVRPERGEIRVAGRDVEGPGPDRGMVFQQYALYPWLTVSQNIEFGLRPLHRGRSERRRIVQEWVARVRLQDFENAYPRELSGGMTQRVAIARALAPTPALLLLDEPFGALDAQTRFLMQELLNQIVAEVKTSVVFVTHDIDEALMLGDELRILSRRPGRIIEEIRNPFDRPRSAHIFSTAQYGQLKEKIFEVLRRELEET